jgi:hypothetical protein
MRPGHGAPRQATLPKLPLLLILSAVLSLTAACGGSESDDDAGAPGSGGDAEATATPSSRPRPHQTGRAQCNARDRHGLALRSARPFGDRSGPSLAGGHDLDHLRDEILALACVRLGMNPHHGREADRLPPMVLGALHQARAASVDRMELRRSNTALLGSFASKVA